MEFVGENADFQQKEILRRIGQSVQRWKQVFSKRIFRSSGLIIVHICNGPGPTAVHTRLLLSGSCGVRNADLEEASRALHVYHTSAHEDISTSSGRIRKSHFNQRALLIVLRRSETNPVS